MKFTSNKKFYGIIFLALSIIGAIVLFILEIIVSDPITERERGIFNAVEFILAIAIGWQLQRIASEEEFKENLKQFALSAYRRIRDIEKSVLRMNNEIARMRTNYPSDRTHELDVLSSLTEVTKFTVQSSIADWSEIIGEEVRKKEKLEGLQQEEQTLRIKRIFSDDPIVDNRISELTQEITKLRSELPYMLQSDLRNSYEIPSSDYFGAYSDEAFRRLYETIENNSVLTLTIKLNPRLSEEEIKEFIKIGSRTVSIRVDLIANGYSLRLFGKNGYFIGFIESPFLEKEISYIDFAHTLILMLGLITNTTDTLSVFPRIPSNFVLSDVEIVVNKEKQPLELTMYIRIPRSVQFGRG